MKYLIILFLLIPDMSSESHFVYKWQNPTLNSIVEREARKHKLNPRLIYNMIEAESSGRVKAKHPLIRIRIDGKLITTRAVGLMGIVREFHFKGTKAQLEKPANNISTGLRVLTNCIHRAKGDLIKGLRYYNGQVNNKDDKYINKILKGII